MKTPAFVNRKQTPLSKLLVHEIIMKQASVVTAKTLLVLLVLILVKAPATAQETSSEDAQVGAVSVEKKLKELPGYQKYKTVSDARRKLTSGGRIQNLKWSADFDAFSFTEEGKSMVFSLADLQKTAFVKDKFKPYKPDGESSAASGRRRFPGRARQRQAEPSPDKQWTATHRDNNVWLVSKDKTEKQITSNGTDRVRFGTSCWVYGEELDQNDAMWWSDDSQRLAFYETNESHMTDYFLTIDNAELYTKVQTVRYPKAGDPNPKVAIHVYDVEQGILKRLEIEGDETQYLFNIKFLPNGHDLLVSRTNRKQDKLDLLAINVDTGETRTLVSERQETWQENRPTMTMLKDGHRFIWETERNGYKHFELRDLDGNRLNPLSESGDYPCQSIVKIDEEADWLYFTAATGKNPYNVQLFRVRFDGTEHSKVTDSELSHSSFQISPDHQHVVAKREQFNVAPSTAVYACKSGKEIAVVAESDPKQTEELGLSAPELFSFITADGKTEIYGTLHKPSNFDENKSYPLLISVYGGPTSSAFSNRHTPAVAACELGFLVAKIGNRGTSGRGKAFESAGYRQLGVFDIEDQAEGVKHLRQRSYVDGNRVGIYGHSYGGYMSALAVLKYPEVFHCSVAGAPVTSWRNYDTIYTERYMWTPQENKEGYDAGDCMKYADQLKGRLLLVHGLIDDNVHPSNTWQLAKELQAKDKRFDMMIYPGFKHGVGSTYRSLIWEYFVKHLRPSN